VCDLTTAKPQRDLALVTVIKEATNVANLDVVVTVIRPQPTSSTGILTRFPFDGRLN